MLEIIGVISLLAWMAGIGLLSFVVRFDDEPYPWVAVVGILVWPLAGLICLCIYLSESEQVTKPPQIYEDSDVEDF